MSKSMCLCLISRGLEFCGAEYFSFAVGRTGESFGPEADVLEHAADCSFGTVGGQDIISEWLGGFQGLGVYMTRVKKSYAYDKMFAVIFLITALSLLLMKAVDLIQRFVMPWNRLESVRKDMDTQKSAGRETDRNK